MNRTGHPPGPLFGLAPGLAFGAALLALAASPAAAREGPGAGLDLTPSRDSGVTGRATLVEVAEGVRVDLEMRGLPEAGVEHINHFHAGGTCADDRAGRTAPVTIPLEPVVAGGDGTGSASTVVEDVTLEELFGDDEERFLLLHARVEGGGVPPGIACADLARTAGIPEERLPHSGGPPAALLLGVLGAICAGAALVGFRLAR